MPQVFRPVRWRVVATGVLVGAGVAVAALRWPGAALPGRLAGLLLAGLFAVAVAAPVAEQVEVDAELVTVRRLLRGVRVFPRAGSAWSVGLVGRGRRRRSRFEVLTLSRADGPTADVLLTHYRAEHRRQLLAAVAQTLTDGD